MSKNELKIFIGMSRTLMAINRKSDEIFSKYNLTRSQFAVLEALYHKGELCIGQVQRLILTTSGNIPVIVKNLEKEDLLTKIKDDKDNRKYILKITEKGINLIEKVYPENEKLIIDMIDIWDESEQKNLIKYFKKFRNISEKNKNE